ncbi:ABC transporter ATP-binding protein [Paenarthrobacter nicotinovorans]|uniref:ABC transporter ATP-binding protein n=1 Tax=Paenarthrobacter nicotinovorans TaxID=29320 RepID=UPI0024862AE9|nr:ABC transporter ATP-binding protein [Paenarthrobacter nicotinovorans]MDI2019763.1 Bacitracin export ATP-binding protein BceA [Paenarthrobacter nicotinovorans]
MTSIFPGAAPAMRQTTEVLRLESIIKTYGSKTNPTTALGGVSLSLQRGSFIAIMGPSGSGKSTLLHCAAGLDTPTSGSIQLGGTAISRLSGSELTAFRRDNVGFVFQAYNLLPALSVEENISLPMLLAGGSVDKRWLDSLLDSVGLTSHKGKRPSELSGGQQQRVAIARALITRPHIVFGDEPTGALDSRSGHQVLDLLANTARELSQTVVIVTHDPVVASYADMVIFLVDGTLAGHLAGASPAQITEHMNSLGEW